VHWLFTAIRSDCFDMKYFLRSIQLIFIIFFMISCEKEEVKAKEFLSDTERIEKEIQSVVDKYSISKCDVYLWNEAYSAQQIVKVHNEIDFKLSNGFLVINSIADSDLNERRYNLLYLSKFTYSPAPNENLSFYFSEVSWLF
jgi:hypothetical protein